MGCGFEPYMAHNAKTFGEEGSCKTPHEIYFPRRIQPASSDFCKPRNGKLFHLKIQSFSPSSRGI